jgi:molybdopterin-containing oxidoreductase family membrane subunit
LAREPLVLNQRSPGWLSDTVAGVVEAKTPLWWWISFGISFPTMIMCFSLIAYLIGTGVGVWGNMHPVMWAWDITNFVWWIGIGHAEHSFPQFSFAAPALARRSTSRGRR